ncbi:MAG: DUF389 domain-containing protein [Anaerolineae bacterium]|nr:DUF389 domain-containing protein [Anaerolineae bacterium]
MSYHNDESTSLEEAARSRARRRRENRRIVPHGKNSRVQFLDQLTRQATPSLTDFALVLISAIMAGIALITDAPAFYIFAILMAPFLSPLVGLALGTLVGSGRFFLQSLVGILIILLVFFGCGAAAGWIVDGARPEQFVMAHHLAFVSVADLLLLTFGAVFTIQRLAKNPEQKPNLVGAALTYEILIPAAVAGFGFTSGIQGLGTSALITLLVHLSWAILIGAITLAVLGLRPNGWQGYAMTGAVVVIALVSAVAINGSVELPQMPHLEAAVIPTIRPTSAEPTATQTDLPTDPSEESIVETATEIATATATPKPSTPTSLPPTRTATPEPTLTLTPEPTPDPRLAIINAREGTGAMFRTGPYISATTVEGYTTLLNGIWVKLYETVENDDGEWGHVRLVSDDSVEGWVLLSLLSIEN